MVRGGKDRRIRVTFSNGGVNSILIVGSIAGHRRHGIRDLVEQSADLGAVIDVFAGQRRSHDLAGLGIDAEVQLPPRSPHLGAVLLNQPLAGATELQPRAVHQQVQGLGTVIGGGSAAAAALPPLRLAG